MQNHRSSLKLLLYGLFMLLIVLVIVLGFSPKLIVSGQDSATMTRHIDDRLVAIYDVDPEALHAPWLDDGELLPDRSRVGTFELGQLRPPSWSRLALQVYADRNWRIKLTSPNDEEIEFFPATGIDHTAPNLDRGAQRLVYASRQGNPSYDLYMLAIGGSESIRLTSDAAEETLPAWSPDGQSLVYQATTGINTEIFVLHVDGSTVQQLTATPAFDGHPAWSPDGTQIVFSSNRTGQFELWLMNADGSNQRQLTHDAHALYPAWNPRGNLIAYAGDGNLDGFLEIWQIRADGTAPTLLYFPSGTRDYWAPTWSPDGRWLAHSTTSWVQRNQQWFWTRSFITVRLHDPDAQYDALYWLNPGNDAWRAHWTTTDNDPPTPCQIKTDPVQRARSFVVGVTATDVGAAGVSTFDLQMRRSTEQTWRTLHPALPMPFEPIDNGTSALYIGQADGRVQFRCQASDRAGNVTAWDAVATVETMIDSQPPQSTVRAAQRFVRGDTTVVTWDGTDVGSGIAKYQLWLRAGGDSDWKEWQESYVAGSTSLTGVSGQTLSLRSQAIDGVGHIEPWSPAPQAEITFYTTILTTTITDIRGQPLAGSSIESVPETVYQMSLGSGRSQLLLRQALTHTITASAGGFGAVLPINLATAEDSTLHVVLPPIENLVRNGGFEEGLAGWIIPASGAAGVQNIAHSGGSALQLTSAVSGTVAVSQVIAIDAALSQPTFSFFALAPNELAADALQVEFSSPSHQSLLVPTLTTADWNHVWADLSPFAGEEITITFVLSDASGPLYLDDVVVGSWSTLRVKDVSPRTWPGAVGTTLTITGENFLPTPTVFLGQTSLQQVQWISPTQLSALVPPNFKDDTADLRVVNPDGDMDALPAAVTVQWEQVYFPLVQSQSRHAPWEAEWPTLGQNVAHTFSNPHGDSAARYSFVWRSEPPFTQEGTEVVLQGMVSADGVLVATYEVYYGSNGVLALDANNGHLLWHHNFPEYHSMSGPTIAHDAVYLAHVTMNNASFIRALDLFTGKEDFRALIFGNSSTQSPLVLDDRVFLQGRHETTLALDAGNGKQYWFGGAPIYGMRIAPAYANNVLYTWGWGIFDARLATSGEEIWTLNLTSHNLHFPCEGALQVSSELVFVATPGQFFVVDLDRRDLRWMSPGGCVRAALASDQQQVYLANQEQIEVRQFDDGALLWSIPAENAYRPVIVGHNLYVATDQETRIYNRFSREQVGVLAQSGELLVNAGFLYIGKANGQIFAYRAQELQ